MSDTPRVKLWNAINRYVVACGGDPNWSVYGNIPRQQAVSEIEALFDERSNTELAKALEECVAQLREVRTGCDFEAECWSVADGAENTLAKHRSKEGEKE